MSHIPELVLIVDPDRDQQWILANALRSRFHFVGASSLTEAHASLVQDRPTIVLVELDEPDGDGLDWIRYLRGDPRWHSLTIACVTRRSGFGDKIAGFKAGADDYIVKPVDFSTFLARITLLQHIRRLGLVPGRP